MRYMGGKHRQSKALAEIIGRRHMGASYYEPFCGALGSAEKVAPYMGISSLSDASEPLINFWRAMMLGWEPPDTVSEETYARYAARRHTPDAQDPMTAYCGYAMSFGGKWFGGLARCERGKHQQMAQKAACVRKAKVMVENAVRLECADYRDVVNKIAAGAVVYLDPPYASGTIAHHTAKRFDHSEFWRLARDLSGRAYVYVSEFTAPPGWVPVHVWGDTVVRHGAQATPDKSEALYVVGGL